MSTTMASAALKLVHETPAAEEAKAPPFDFFAWQAEVMDRNLLALVSGNAGKLLWVLGRHANAKAQAWPSRETLMKKTGIRVTAFKNAVRELVKARFVRRRKRMGETTTYTIITDFDPGLFADAPDAGVTPKPRKPRAEQGAQSRPNQGADAPPQGAQLRPNPGADAPPEVHMKYSEGSTQEAVGRSQGEKRKEATELFSRWLNAPSTRINWGPIGQWLSRCEEEGLLDLAVRCIRHAIADPRSAPHTASAAVRWVQSEYERCRQHECEPGVFSNDHDRRCRGKATRDGREAAKQRRQENAAREFPEHTATLRRI